MIISHKHKFIFIAIPKTGTHAIRQALRKQLGSQDEEQVSLFKVSRLSNKELANLGNGHITAIQAKKYLPKDIWDSYYKFSFVRNPFDRFISFAFFFYDNHPVMNKHANLHLKNLLLFPEERRELWSKEQSDFLLDTNNELLVDFVGKVETMQNDFNIICDKLNLKYDNLNKINTSSHNHYKSYYDQILEKMVAEKYSKDFEAFDYNNRL